MISQLHCPILSCNDWCDLWRSFFSCLQAGPPSRQSRLHNFKNAEKHAFGYVVECAKIARFSAVAEVILTAPCKIAIFKTQDARFPCNQKVVAAISLRLERAKLIPIVEKSPQRCTFFKGNQKGQTIWDKPNRIRSFSQIFADFCRFSLFLGIIAFRRRRFSQETADFRRKPQKTADFRRNWFVPFTLSLLVPPYFCFGWTPLYEEEMKA